MPSRFYTAFVNIAFSGLILLAAFAVLRPFLLAILWAAVIAVATWPLHVRIRVALKGDNNRAAILSTLVIGVALVAPMAVLLVLVVAELNGVAAYLITADKNGAPVPAWLPMLPGVGELLAGKWNQYLASPHQISGLLQEWMSAKVNLLQEVVNVVLLSITSRMATLFFALLVLFFIYRDGERLLARINLIGVKWLQKRWHSYAHHIPPSLRAAVNGLVIVGLGEAVILSALYQVFGIPSAVLLGLGTALIAFIPMAAPLVLAIVGFLMFVTGSPLGGIFVFSVGTAVVMAADYVVRPMLIQGSAEIHFLAVLFGILGGVATMGVLGLILGPVILVLLMVLFREASVNESADMGL